MSESRPLEMLEDAGADRCPAVEVQFRLKVPADDQDLVQHRSRCVVQERPAKTPRRHPPRSRALPVGQRQSLHTPGQFQHCHRT